MAIQYVSKDELLTLQGTKLEPSAWSTMDQARIDAFADVTEDHQFIHVDSEKAAQTPLGGTIAHGFLTLSMLSHLVEDNGILPENVVMGLNYGFDKVRFLAPVRSGKRIRAHIEILDVAQKDDNRLLIKQGITIEIDGEDTPALVAEWLTMAIVG